MDEYYPHKHTEYNHDQMGIVGRKNDDENGRSLSERSQWMLQLKVKLKMRVACHATDRHLDVLV